MKFINLKDRIFNYSLINSKFINQKRMIIKKEIGEKSKNSNIYICVFKDISVCLKSSVNNYKDLRISLRLSSIALTNVNPHFLISYRLLNKNKIISELATGTLKSFLSYYITIDIIINTIIQILIAIHSFHKYTSLSHCDCYHENFLYHRIVKDDSYFKYRICEREFYIKNEGYLWLINDFDLADEDDNSYEDFKISLEAFMCYSKRINKSKSLKTQINRIVDIVWKNSNSSELILELIETFNLNKIDKNKKINSVCYNL